VATGTEKADYDKQRPDDDPRKKAVLDFAKLLSDGGGGVELSPNIQAARWEKELWSVNLFIFLRPRVSHEPNV
jgi:ketopantoate reductase